MKDGLRGLETRVRETRKAHRDLTDVLIVVEVGDAPARTPFNASLPFYYTNQNGELRSMAISIAFPVIRPARPIKPLTLQLGDYTGQAAPIMNLNLMARRALHDEMPGLIFRGLTRAASKRAMQYYSNEANPWLGLAAMLFSVATEHADDRTWRSLPGHVLLLRTYLPPGTYPLSIEGRDSGKTIDIQGKYAMVAIRVKGRYTSVSKTAIYDR